MNEPLSPTPANPLFQSHPRTFQANRYVYVVLSRRSEGLSIGVNLNLDKICNFGCVYCQVDRRQQAAREFLEISQLRRELDETVELVASRRIYDDPKYSGVPPALRRLADIAFSGDGEPTTYRNFAEVVEVAAEIRRRRGLDGVKLVLITNASRLHRPEVRRGLEILDANHGEIWAKLDAGTEAYYRQVARSTVRFQRILENLALAARARPIVIQSLFMRIRGEPPDPVEQQAYCARLNEICGSGGRIALVQVHTIARPPAESWVSPLDREELEAIAARVRTQTGLAVAVH
jgi:wyosine [tRNA(Phe)-imidazoG37] synthetase (radical SAM superfamily)